MIDPVVRVEHVRGATRCMKGARQWFKVNNLSWTVFLEEGYPASVIESTGCPIGAEVAKLAREQADADGR